MSNQKLSEEIANRLTVMPQEISKSEASDWLLRVADLEQSLDRASHHLEGLTFEAVRHIFMGYTNADINFNKAVEQLRDLAAVADVKEFPHD